MNHQQVENHLSDLNLDMKKLDYQERIRFVFDWFGGDDILISTSLGSTSAILLHLISQVAPSHPIYMVDTGYLFDETLKYRDLMQKKLGVNIRCMHPSINKHLFTNEGKSWDFNSDLCCFANKIEPMNRLKKGKKLWISGVLAFQNSNRKNMRVFEKSGVLYKFHPIIDMKKEEVSLYHELFDLPINPLYYQGYGSIGCTHCTSKGEGREGRWLNSNKTECGLHL